MKSLFIIFVLFFSFLSAEIQRDEIYINCATPCLPRNNCYYSTCDTSLGVCVEKIKDILPEECCFSASDCKTADCVFTSCNLDVNQCEYIEICPNPAFNITKRACINDNQCQGDNPCTLSKCIDNVCQNSPLTNPNNNLCCQEANDCASFPCTETFCDVESFNCFYIPILGCEISFGVTVIPTSYYDTTSSSSSSTYSTYAELYDIPSQPDAGDIFFFIIGLLVLLLVVILIIYGITHLIHEYFWGEKPYTGDDIGEKAAAGHTAH